MHNIAIAENAINIGQTINQIELVIGLISNTPIIAETREIMLNVMDILALVLLRLRKVFLELPIFIPFIGIGMKLCIVM